MKKALYWAAFFVSMFGVHLVIAPWGLRLAVLLFTTVGGVYMRYFAWVMNV